jgi:HK97 family phage portal protein
MSWFTRDKPSAIDSVFEERFVSGDTGRSISIGDPALAEYLGFGARSAAGQVVNEQTAVGSTAYWRGVNIISGTIASLPMKSYRKLPDGTREQVPSVFDNPGAPIGLLSHTWVELIINHLLMHGNAYLLHIYNGGGGLAGLQPLHPSAVTVDVSTGQKVFKVNLQAADGATYEPREYTPADLTHIMGLTVDGIKGISPLTAYRNALGTTLAGDLAQGSLFANGMSLGGVVTGKDLSEAQAKQVKAGLVANNRGVDHAGDIAVVNAELDFKPWTMTAESAQFLESRAFQVEEVSRMLGVPKVLLSMDGASSWGSGIAELIRGLARFTLKPLTSRLENSFSALLASPRYVEFEYDGLLAPTPEEATRNIALEIKAGTLTVNEARQLKNRPPLEQVTANTQTTTEESNESRPHGH